MVDAFADAAPLQEHPDFGRPFVDADEWHETPSSHRFVHGGFEGSETRFSFYLPSGDEFQGRFFHYITPVPESEYSSRQLTGDDDRIGFAVSSGGYLIETNGGGPSASDPFSANDSTIGAYRANAAAAIFSRNVAREVYGAGRVYGYAFGGSGGAYRTVGGMENTDGVWDGAVPFVLGSPMAIPNCFTPRLLALRVLGEKLDDIASAMDAGGSGDPYATLDAEQAAVLREVSGMGFPLRSWYAWRTMGMHALAILYPGIRALDPTFFDDFWRVPGYEGGDPSSPVHRDRVVVETWITELLTVADLVDAGIDVSSIPGASTGNADDSWLGRDAAVIVGVRLAGLAAREPGFAELVIASGPGAGARIVLMQTVGEVSIFGPADPAVVAGLAVGDRATLDNSGFLAIGTYHRHQVPGPEYPVWNQFRSPDGEPLYPQRPILVGPIFTAGAAGIVPTGRFSGRMILLESLMDREAYPWQADWYRRRAAEFHGDDLDDRFRVWMQDRALHADIDSQTHPEQSISYGGALHQALRDLAAWVEDGVEPPASTVYTVEDGQVVPAESAADRRGIQPTLVLDSDGVDLVRVGVREPVSVRAVAESPGAGSLVSIEWDLDGDGTFETAVALDPSGRAVDQQATTFDTPGRRFVTARVVSQRKPGTRFARVRNLARLCVEVS